MAKPEERKEKKEKKKKKKRDSNELHAPSLLGRERGCYNEVAVVKGGFCREAGPFVTH